MQAFLREVMEVCRKHGFYIDHDDGEGGIKVHLLTEKNLRWLSADSKSYTREIDPITGKMFAPEYMGDNCLNRDISCATCKFLYFCYFPHLVKTPSQ